MPGATFVNIVVFGASGGTGREVVSQGLAQGHMVTAFTRSPARIRTTHENLKTVTGDITDARAVERAITGQQAVLSCLGAPNPILPYPAFTDGLRNIVQAMGLGGVKRLIYESFIGVSASRAEAGFMIRYVASRILRGAIANHEINERLIQQSLLEWTIVRPPRLSVVRLNGRYRSGEHIVGKFPIQLISRANVADFMLGQLRDTSFVRKSPSILS
jgi:putative NADH-flavin reductase